METWISASGSASVKRIAVIESAAGGIEIVAIDDRAAVRDVSVVVVNCGATVPVIIPVMPAPPESSEETDSKSSTEVNRWTAIKDSGHGNPTRVGDDGLSGYEPRIVGRHVNNIRVGRLNNDRVALSRYILLLVVTQLAGLPSLLAHRLNGICHSLRLVGIGVAKG